LVSVEEGEVMEKYIHPYERNLERQIEMVKQSSLLKKNKEAILKFYQHNLAQGLSPPRLLRQTSVLRITAMQVKKDFRKLTKEDYELFLIWMKKKGYKEGSIWTYKKILVTV
jgi:hypothetical protein